MNVWVVTAETNGGNILIGIYGIRKDAINRARSITEEVVTDSGKSLAEALDCQIKVTERKVL